MQEVSFPNAISKIAMRFRRAEVILYGSTYSVFTSHMSPAMVHYPDSEPLPQSDENSILQTESFKAFNNALPSSRFILRQEPPPDGGIDWWVELRIDGRFTGMRAHVQVKGCTKAKPNADGSISFSANVSNLGYLLNGPSPLYVLYVAQTGELRYVWVRDEARRINATKPNWMRQQTVTLRFVAKLDEHGLEDIHERVGRDARITTQFHELLGRTDIRERTIHVDLKNATIIDPDAIREVLIQGGLTLVSSGDPAKVLEAIDKLSYADKHLPRVLLVQAYAKCSQGRYQTGSGILMDLVPKAGELPESDRQFAALLRDICDHQLGRISTPEYVERQKRAAQDLDEEFALSRRIDHLWYQLLGNGNRRGIELYLPPLREAVARVLAMKDASEAFRIQARTAGLFGDGVELIERADHDLKILQLMRTRAAGARLRDISGLERGPCPVVYRRQRSRP